MEQGVQAQYLQDILSLLRDMAKEAKKRRDKAVGTNDYSYSLGYLMAFYEVVSLLQSQAIAFDINLADLGVDDIFPDRDLL